MTAYERSNDRAYSGKLAMFGECVLGYLRTDLKAAPRWQHGIWLGKTMSGDLHIVGHADGVFVTRSIRRNPVPFDLERLGGLETWPWEYGYAALGNRLIYSKKRLSQPMAFGVGAALPPHVDVEAIQVQVYADANPDEDVEHPGEAGTMPQADLAPDAQGSGSLGPKVEGSKTERSSDPMDVALQHGQKRPDDPNTASTASSSKKFKPDTSDVDPDLLHLLDDSDIGERVPKTPKLDDDVAKQLLNQVTSADLSLYEHEDENVTFPFTDNDLDVLEEYDWNLVDDEWLDGYDSFDSSALDDKEIIKQLTFPYRKHEPNLSDEELMRLDALADGIEIKRLVKMNVLTDAASVGESPKKLSTRFVRTWREKHDEKGQPIWLRRSRFVAREFAWLQPGSSIVSRLLPTMFLDMRESFNAVMASMDFKDAFLTVEQKTPAVVDCVLADGQSISYGLGRVLPGQRDGSLMWYKDLTKMLKDDLGMVEHGPYPCILKTADSSCLS